MSKRQIDVLDKSGLIEFDKRRIVAFVRFLDDMLPENLRAPKGVLSIAFFNDRDIAKIHADFMDKPNPTDVITFEGDSDDDFAGEICASAQTALANAPKFSTSPSDELALYVAHGYLHLAGVDDISEADALKMRAAEALAMKILKAKFRKPIFNFIKK